MTSQEIILGEAFLEIAVPGKEDVREISHKTLIVPFAESLEQMLSNDEVRKFVDQGIKSSTDNVIRSAVDGSIWKNHPVFKKYPKALIFQIYEDDVEVVNALGSRTGVHKLTNIYWSLLNIPEYLRSNLKSISLLACVKSSYIKEYGFAPVLKDFFTCIEKLQSDTGLELCVDGEKIFVHGSLLSVNGDGLALNFIGGFKEGIGGATKPCRYCSMTRT